MSRLELNRIEVCLDCPGNHDLPRAQGGLPERGPYPLGGGPTGFFRKLSGGSIFIQLTLFDQPFEDRPPSVVPVTEIGTAGVTQQELQTVTKTEWQKTCRSDTLHHYAGPVTVITATTPSSNQVVVTPLPDFRLGQTEPLPVGLKRLTMGEMEGAVSRFYDGEQAFPSAVHEARKSTKRIRAVLRLIRYEIGEQVFVYEDNWMRETARVLAPSRDAISIVEMMDVLENIYGHLLVEGALSETRDRLDWNRRWVVTRTMEDPETVVRLVENLERAHGRYSNWPVDPSARSVYGVGIRDEFAAISPGFHKTYLSGRQRMVSAYSHRTPEGFHKWRKSVKYLCHQMELMTPLWPEVVVGMAITLKRVGELLGQDHDLTLLLDSLESDTRICPDPVQRSLIRALANQRRSDLQTAARILGRRVFAEEPDSITKRLDVYWEARDPATLTALSALSL